jgi:tetratricopeptide (TPR) repeat protein
MSPEDTPSPEAVRDLEEGRLLLVTGHDPLIEAVRALVPEGIECQIVSNWSEAEPRLVESSYDLLCLDYEEIEVEGVECFVQMDNILQKEETPGVLVMRSASSRAENIYQRLESFRESVSFGAGESSDREELREAIEPLLEHRRDTRPSNASRASAAKEGDREPSGEWDSREADRTIRVPVVDRGTLDGSTLVEMLHRLDVREATGRLTLEHDTIERTYLFDEGTLLSSDRGSEVETLEPAFAWDEGTYRFEPLESVQGRSISLHRRMLEGLHDHLSQRDALDALVSRMERHPVWTERWERRRSSLDDYEELERFVTACDGGETLESVLSRFGANARRGFQAAYFALSTDLVLLEGADEVEAPPLTIEYDLEDRSDGPVGETDSSGEQDVRARLQRARDRIRDADPYEIFDLWEGCGEQAVRERFYDLVKRYHPDTYGDALPSDLESESQELFIRVKEARSTLLEHEDEQRVSESEAREESQIGASSSVSVRDEGSDVIASGERGGGEESHARTLSDDSSDASTSTLFEASSEPPTSLGAERSSPDGGGESGRTAPPDRTRQATPSAGSVAEEQGRRRTPSGETEERPDTAAERESGRRASRAREEKLERIRNRRDDVSQVLEGASEPEEQEEAQELFNAGYKAFKNDAEADAFDYISRAHDFDPDNALYKTFYGYLLFLNEPDRRDDAQELLEEAIQMENDQVLPDAHLFLGRIMRVKDRDDRACQHFERALRLNPSSLEAQRELRVYEMRDKDYGVDVEAIVDASTVDTGEHEAVESEGETMEEALRDEKEGEDEPSFSEDPAGYIKNLLNKDLF